VVTEAPAGGATRRHILKAAEQIIQEKGLGAATTRAIALQAGCAEGSIYRYFPDKHALFMEVVLQQSPEFLEVLHGLESRVGISTVRLNLEQVALVSLRFYRTVIPLVGGSMAEHKLLQEQRRHFQETKRGPMKAFAHLNDYLRMEQRLGRVAGRCSPEHVSRLLLATCFGQAFMEELVGDEARLGGDEAFAREVVRTLMEGCGPKKKPVAVSG